MALACRLVTSSTSPEGSHDPVRNLQGPAHSGCAAGVRRSRRPGPHRGQRGHQVHVIRPQAHRITHGVATFVILLGGFGALARLGVKARKPARLGPRQARLLGRACAARWRSPIAGLPTLVRCSGSCRCSAVSPPAWPSTSRSDRGSRVPVAALHCRCGGRPHHRAGSRRRHGDIHDRQDALRAHLPHPPHDEPRERYFRRLEGNDQRRPGRVERWLDRDRDPDHQHRHQE